MTVQEKGGEGQVMTPTKNELAEREGKVALPITVQEEDGSERTVFVYVEKTQSAAN